MNKWMLLVSMVCIFPLAGCFEATEEITLKENGSGIVSNTTDLSQLIAMVKGMGGNDLKDTSEKAIDTTILLEKIADSIPLLTDEERMILKKGKLGLTLNLKDEKLITKVEIPFSKADQIEKIKGLSSRITQYFVGKNTPDEMPPGMDDMMGGPDPLTEYFVTNYSRGLIEKKLDKVKYASANNSESLQGLKEMTENGLPASYNIIINLPKPVKKAEGKNVKVSEDKRKVTISGTSEDFFDNAAVLEFRIEY